MSPQTPPLPAAAPPRDLSLHQLSGLWEVPLFALSLLLIAGTALLATRDPAVPGTPAVQPPPAPPSKPASEAPDPLRLSAARVREGKLTEALEILSGTASRDLPPRLQPALALARGEILERLADPASLLAAEAEYRTLLDPKTDPAPLETEAASARFRLARVAWGLFQAEPNRRDLARLEALLTETRAAAVGLAASREGDEAAYLEGQVLESLGRSEEAEAAYRRVGPGRRGLRAAALVRVAACLRKRQPPALGAAHAAAMEAIQDPALKGSPWIAEPALTRELELLSQSWQERDEDARALAIEAALATLAEDPVPHVLHAAEIHERRAERLQAQAAETGGEAAAALQLQAKESWREAGRTCRGPVENGMPAPYARLLFRAADAFERAGDVDRAVESLEHFVTRFHDDGHFPEAVYRLGRQYRLLGLYDKALDLFTQSRAAMREERGVVHYVPLTLYEEGICAYLSRAPGARERALSIFSRILEHPDIYPESQTWRDSLFAMACLRHEDAMSGKDPQVLREASDHLREWLDRYPGDPRIPQARWMLGLLAWSRGDWRESGDLFEGVLADLGRGPAPGAGATLATSRSAALLAAEARYREGAARGDRALLTRAREAFLEARDLNLGSWRAPWALARMGDCAQALGQTAEAKALRASARWEYAQLGPAAGPAPEDPAGIQALVSWRSDALERLGAGGAR